MESRDALQRKNMQCGFMNWDIRKGWKLFCAEFEKENKFSFRVIPEI